LPCRLDALLESARLGNPGKLRLDRDAFFGRLGSNHLPHRLIVLVLVQQRHRQRELGAKRLHDVANTVDRRRRRDTLNLAALAIDRLDFQHAIGAGHARRHRPLTSLV
jgi:hypothetical protein